MLGRWVRLYFYSLREKGLKIFEVVLRTVCYVWNSFLSF